MRFTKRILNARECKGNPEQILKVLLDLRDEVQRDFEVKFGNTRYIVSSPIYNELSHYHNMNWFMTDLQIYDSTMYCFGIKIIYDESLDYGEIRIVYEENDMPTFGSLRQLHIASLDTVKIKKVIFNGPATIVYWSDNTKTVVKCDGEEKFYDTEKGLAMAICKKMLGLKEFYTQYNKAIDEVNERK